ncbi:MAG TPA: hypothetical protein VMT39_01370 [Candidatus Bathyarchaeia archaeon]|nr:hypothetical protein [Candidatus Bathyarchaeia archaeon]
MELQLNEVQRRLLQEIREERHKNLIHEIARTDHREARQELQNRCLLIEGLLKQMKAIELVAA